MTPPEREALPGFAARRAPAEALARHALPLAALLLLALLAYADSFNGAFVFDDLRHVRDNPLIRDLGNFVGSWRAWRAQPHRFVGYLTFALNYRLGGLAPTGYHVFNFGVHALNAALLYSLVVLAFRAPLLERSSLAGSARAVAFVAAALFATHPLETQAVTYVVQRLTSLATLFYLLTVVLFARWRLGGWSARAAAGCYGALLIAALLAMRTKEIAFTLPLAVALYEISFLEAPWRRRLRFLAPIFATGLVIPISLALRAGALGDPARLGEATRLQTAMSRLDYLRTEIPVVVTYLRLLFLPVGQSLDHDFSLYRSFLAGPVLGSLLILGALAASAVLLHRRSAPGATGPGLDPALRMVSFGIGWFFLALSVESAFVPIVDVIFEHRAYLPSVGFFAAAGTLIALAARALSLARAERLTWQVGGALAVVLALVTLVRNQVWADEVSIWTDAAARSNRLRPHLNLGTALASAGRFQAGARELGRAVEIDPDSAYARAQLGTVLLALGRPAEAEPQLREAIRLQPEDPDPVFNLAVMLARTGRGAEAKPWFARFLEVAPPSYAGARRIAAAQLARGSQSR